MRAGGNVPEVAHQVSRSGVFHLLQEVREGERVSLSVAILHRANRLGQRARGSAPA